MSNLHISKNLDYLRLSPWAWNKNIHIHNWSRRCLENCCWTGVFNDDVKVLGSNLRVDSNGCTQCIRVSAMVCYDSAINLHVACKRGNSWKTHRSIGSCWTCLSKRKCNSFIASWTLRYCKRNRVWLRGYPNLDCLCRWNRSAESQGCNSTR